jgi:gamma-glutamylcysteine synthetase
MADDSTDSRAVVRQSKSVNLKFNELQEYIDNLEHNLKANKELVHSLILESAAKTEIVPIHYL